MAEKLKNIILIFGDEEYLKEQKKKELLDALHAPGSLNFSSFSGENLDLLEIRRLSQTLPFYEDHRTILIEDADLFGKNFGLSADFCSALDALPESTFIIFYEKNVLSKNPLYILTKKKGTVYRYESVASLKGNEKKSSRLNIKNWAREVLKKEKREIDASTLNGLLELTGYDMQNLSTELSKLISYTFFKPAGYRIQVCDIDAIASRTLSDRVFLMMDMKLNNDIKGAIVALEELLNLRVPPLRILSLLERQYYQALSVRAMLDEHADDSEILRMMEIRDWQLGKLKDKVRGVSYKELLKRFEECVFTDFKIKTGDIGATLGLEILMLS